MRSIENKNKTKGGTAKKKERREGETATEEATGEKSIPPPLWLYGHTDRDRGISSCPLKGSEINVKRFTYYMLSDHHWQRKNTVSEVKVATRYIRRSHQSETTEGRQKRIATQSNDVSG
jgi:hypothetical protein